MVLKGGGSMKAAQVEFGRGWYVNKRGWALPGLFI